MIGYQGGDSSDPILVGEIIGGALVDIHTALGPGDGNRVASLRYLRAFAYPPRRYDRT